MGIRERERRRKREMEERKRKEQKERDRKTRQINKNVRKKYIRRINKITTH